MFKFCKENDEFETMNFVQAGLALTLLFVHLAVFLRYKKVSKVKKPIKIVLKFNNTKYD